MRQAFQQICIFKPNASRPANSERYFVCRSRVEDVGKVRELLWAANEKFSTLPPDIAIRSIVPLSVLFADGPFMDYLVQSNNSLGRRQTNFIDKIRAFCMDETLKETRQQEMKIGCLNLWKIPNSARTIPRFRQPEEIFSELGATFSQNSKELTPDVLSRIKCLDWRCFAVSSSRHAENCTLFLSAGRGTVYYMDRGVWKNVSELKVKLDLPAKTLLFGEIVHEHRGEGGAQISQKVLHVMDAHQLGDTFIGRLSFKVRYEFCIKFANAVNKKTRPDLTLPIDSLQVLNEEEDVLKSVKFDYVVVEFGRSGKSRPSATTEAEMITSRWLVGKYVHWPK
ncbi:Hypothetical predicted protein [Cloeon dipterum]|uniref:Cap-specific mRNA (nucleoside-2'-O-)-methyltransferase 1 n=1 Tax=Cloeon dipterum TaxID=197152 RepID=A0A8S1DYP5_9INSE|nr:Hypothetical predicted protein [Cloeon dipterum]